MRRRKNTADDFWDRVDRTGPTGCWLWTKSKQVSGYGQFWFGGRNWTTHRLSYTLTRGPIPPGLGVCHSCDCPSCVNPDHLFLGSQADNMADMVAKNRQRKGGTAGNARLTESQVLAIRADTRSHQSIAADYGVHRNTIWRIKYTLTWRHI